MNNRTPIIFVANALAGCALVAANLMPQSSVVSVLRYVALVYLWGGLILLAGWGYFRRRPHWTAQSWRRYLATCAIPVGALVVVACLLMALDRQLVGPAGSLTRTVFAVISVFFLVFGAGGLAVTIVMLHQGDPSKPFSGPLALLRPFSGTHQ